MELVQQPLTLGANAKQDKEEDENSKKFEHFRGHDMVYLLVLHG